MKYNIKIFLILIFTLLSKSAFLQDTTFYFKTSDDVQLYVRIAGQGTSCLFLHGGPGSTSYYFEGLDVARRVEQRLQMIYFDQRGSGRSSSPISKNYTIARHLQDIEELRSYLGIKKWLVMGHSFAGLIMTPYATTYPNPVLGMIYIDCTIDLVSSLESQIKKGKALLHDYNGRHNQLDSKLLLEQAGSVHQRLLSKGLFYKLMYRTEKEKALNDSLTNAIQPQNRDFATNVWNDPAYWKSYSRETAKIQGPILVIQGRKDYAIGPLHYQLFHCKNQMVKKHAGGHVPFQEDATWFEQTLTAFLNTYQFHKH